MSAPNRDARAHGAAPAGALAAPVEPVERAGHWSWEIHAGGDRFVFFGKAIGGTERDIDDELARAGLAIASVRQIHSRRVLEAAPGERGEGDALVSTAAGLALRIVTADCVPVLLASPAAIAAVHAGWRGLRAGILDAAVRRLGPARPRRAVIGPAIGRCCYEVGADVAAVVAARTGSSEVIVRRGEGRRPHLDLALAARLALREAGVEEIVTIDACTRCDASRLWSYRREGKGAGRNLAFVWREA